MEITLGNLHKFATQYGTLKMLVGLLLVVSLAAGQTGNPQDSTEPPDHGAYYRTKDGWQKLEMLIESGIREHISPFGGGVKNIYRGAEAPVQLSDRRPVFYIKTTPDKEAVMAVAARNTVVVLLSKKEDHRELQSIKANLLGGKGGLDKKRMPDVTLHSINNLMITVTPNQDLAPGEYLLTWDSMGHFGYDFGIK
jgi:hypothetical protein